MHKNEIERLIEVGENFSFVNNSKNSQYGAYTQVSDEFLGWLANTDSFIIDNYGENSGPYKLLKKIDQNKLNGYEQDDFIEQKSIILGALKACKTLPPKEFKASEHPIIDLLKNKVFWTILVITLGGAFALGLHFGTSKFDREKLDLYEENRKLIKNNKTLSDSLKMVKKSKLDKIK
ncbi:hypothetical protein [Tenacibaculum maritimum]|uniref:hypothetical protein n=1 Tax=Tenacibaculum maritimum TaxID=107401 RepID=UPI0038773404